MKPADGRQPDRRLRVTVIVLAVVTVAGLTPSPLNIVFAEEPAAHVWRLDGRLVVNGVTVNPEGRWSFVAVGRPELLAETVSRRLTGKQQHTRNVRAGSLAHRPVVAEPLAAAAGLALAGVQITANPVLVIEDRSQVSPALTAVALNGSVAALVALRDGLAHAPVETLAGERSVFTLRDGSTVAFTAAELATKRFSASEVLNEVVTAAIRWRAQRYVPQQWFRSLAVGNSHGLMVALVTYTNEVHPDLARGIHVAGTGVVRTDGTVLRVGGVRAKAKAAHRAGADVFFFPAAQADDLADFALDGMDLVPVDDLHEAMLWLQQLRG